MQQKEPLFSSTNFLPKLIVGICIFLIGIWVGKYVALPFLPGDSPKITVLNKLTKTDTVDFKTFWETWDKLTTTYLNKKDLTGEKLLHGAISGLVNSVGDPYTLYYDPESNKAFSEDLSGVFEGVGIELGTKDNKLVVVAPLEDSPASKAGILAGDLVVSIDGKEAPKQIADAVKQIRGKAGTKVKLTILRDGKEEKTFEVTREKITVKSVKLEEKDGVATVSVTRFGDNTKSEWDKVVNEITSDGIGKVILDLRNDPGGRLDTAIYIAGDFLNQTDVVLQQEDSDGNRKSYTSEANGRLKSVKLVVLINKGSASASEIVAGALADHDKATLVGETSFGKGVVQSVADFDDGAGLHITVAKWLTPKGTWIHGTGIKPDVEVKRSADDINAGKDPQLDKAQELLK